MFSNRTIKSKLNCGLLAALLIMHAPLGFGHAEERNKQGYCAKGFALVLNSSARLLGGKQKSIRTMLVKTALIAASVGALNSSHQEEKRYRAAGYVNKEAIVVNGKARDVDAIDWFLVGRHLRMEIGRYHIIPTEQYMKYLMREEPSKLNPIFQDSPRVWERYEMASFLRSMDVRMKGKVSAIMERHGMDPDLMRHERNWQKLEEKYAPHATGYNLYVAPLQRIYTNRLDAVLGDILRDIYETETRSAKVAGDTVLIPIDQDLIRNEFTIGFFRVYPAGSFERETWPNQDIDDIINHAYGWMFEPYLNEVFESPIPMAVARSDLSSYCGIAADGLLKIVRGNGNGRLIKNLIKPDLGEEVAAYAESDNGTLRQLPRYVDIGSNKNRIPGAEIAELAAKRLHDLVEQQVMHEQRDELAFQINGITYSFLDLNALMIALYYLPHGSEVSTSDALPD